MKNLLLILLVFLLLLQSVNSFQNYEIQIRDNERGSQARIVNYLDYKVLCYIDENNFYLYPKSTSDWFYVDVNHFVYGCYE